MAGRDDGAGCAGQMPAMEGGVRCARVRLEAHHSDNGEYQCCQHRERGHERCPGDRTSWWEGRLRTTEHYWRWCCVMQDASTVAVRGTLNDRNECIFRKHHCGLLCVERDLVHSPTGKATLNLVTRNWYRAGGGQIKRAFREHRRRVLSIKIEFRLGY